MEKTQYKLKVLYFKEDGFQMIYCPSLNIMLHTKSRSKEELKGLLDNAIVSLHGLCGEVGYDKIFAKLGWRKDSDSEKLLQPHQIPDTLFRNDVEIEETQFSM